MKLVSVIIPAYKTEKYIERCLKSVLDQTYTNLEVIVIDDGSPDNLYKIVEKYARLDSRIKLIRQENRGAAASRNHGLRKSRGDYIIFVDSDDYLEPNAIELLVNKISTENADVVMPDRYTKVGLDGKKSEELLFTNYKKYKTVEDFVVNIIIGQGRAWRVSSVLYDANIIRNYNIKFPEGHIAEDVVFNLEFLSNANKISFLEYPTLNVNKRPDSVTGTYHENILDTYILIDEKAKEYIKKTGYDIKYGEIAVNSLMCRNVILLIDSEMSTKNTKPFKDKVKKIYLILNMTRIKESFKQKQFILPYWNSSIKIYYVVLMRILIKCRLKFGAILLALISNKLRDMR